MADVKHNIFSVKLKEILPNTVLWNEKESCKAGFSACGESL